MCSAVLTGLFALVGAFGGAALTFWFNRQLKEREYWEQRQIAQRAETREVYRRVLGYSLGVLEYWKAVADFNAVTFDAKFVRDRASAKADEGERRRLIAELELLPSSKDTIEAFNQFYAAMEQCRMAYLYVYQNEGILDPEKKPISVNNARSAVARALGEEDARGRYDALRTLMRGELYPNDAPPPAGLRGSLSQRTILRDSP